MRDRIHSPRRGSLSYLTIAFLCLSLIACNTFVRADDSKHPKSPDSSSEDDLKRKAKEILGGSDKQEAGLMNAIKPDEKGPLPFLDKTDERTSRSLPNAKNLVEVDLGFVHAFVASLSVIIVSELGDKTFFIAAIMAMRHPRLTVFSGAIFALALMTVLSAMLGFATTVIPRWFTYYASCALFAIFGLKMLKEAYSMDANQGQEEYEEVQIDLRKKDEEMEKQSTSDVEAGVIRTPQRRILYSLFSRSFLQSFTLTFLAEWGDRSQIATIILAARDEVIGVIIGGTLGHALCTSLAVIGGRCIAQHISIRTVHFVGGVVFLIFALSALFIQPDDHD